MAPQIIALLIPLVAVVMGIGLAMLVIYLTYRKRREAFTLYHQERMAAIERGIELPPVPYGLLSEEAPYNPRRHLLHGLVWLFIGIGIGVAIFATVEFRWALFALVPIGLGLAHLIYYATEGKKEAEALEQKRAASAKA